MGDIGCDVSVADDLAAIVDGEGNAVRSAGEDSEVIDGVAGAPFDGMPCRVGPRV